VLYKDITKLKNEYAARLGARIIGLRGWSMMVSLAMMFILKALPEQGDFCSPTPRPDLGSAANVTGMEVG
jgi:hypothetical protein